MVYKSAIYQKNTKNSCSAKHGKIEFIRYNFFQFCLCAASPSVHVVEYSNVVEANAKDNNGTKRSGGSIVTTMMIKINRNRNDQMTE